MQGPRSRALLEVIDMLTDAVNRLDDLQAGDWRNAISPVKHELRDAVSPIAEKIRAIARQEYEDERTGNDGRHK